MLLLSNKTVMYKMPDSLCQVEQNWKVAQRLAHLKNKIKQDPKRIFHQKSLFLYI